MLFHAELFRGSASRRRRTQGDIRPSKTCSLNSRADINTVCVWCRLWGWVPISALLAARSRVSRPLPFFRDTARTYVRDPTITRVAFSLDAHTAVSVVLAFGTLARALTLRDSVNLWRVAGREAQRMVAPSPSLLVFRSESRDSRDTLHIHETAISSQPSYCSSERRLFEAIIRRFATDSEPNKSCLPCVFRGAAGVLPRR